MEYYFDIGECVLFKKYGHLTWDHGVIVSRHHDTVHMYGEDMVVNCYSIRQPDRDEVVEVCYAWDEIQRSNPLEELARI